MESAGYRYILDSQIAYYDARADEYDSTLSFHAGRFANGNPDAHALEQLQGFVRELHTRNGRTILCDRFIAMKDYATRIRTQNRIVESIDI